MVDEEPCKRINLKENEFGGLIGNFAGQFLRDRVGDGFAGQLIGNIFGGGDNRQSGQGDRHGNGRSGGSGNNIPADNLFDSIGNLIGGGRNRNSGGSGNIVDIIGQFTGNRGGDNRDASGTRGNYPIDDIIGGISSLIGGGSGGNRGTHGNAGGGNIPINQLNGGFVDIIGNLVASAAHRFLGVDPNTGKIIGAAAGNIIFHLGGEDNSLGKTGKVILDNIVSGKFKRKVEPHIRPEPSPLPRRPSPTDYSGEIQSFYELRDQCLREKRLFEDPKFEATDQSLFYSRAPPKSIQWLRPAEIVSDPKLIYAGQSRFDVIQGELGNCWLMAGAAGITLREELFYRVVPPDQSFTDNYAGIFHFQFWQYGHWVDIVIDDRLPTSNGKLLYMHSRENNEFWSALLEKAYAKLYGSYEALKGGTTAEALEDLTGGLTEFVDLRQSPPPNLQQMMLRGFEMGSLFGVSIEADPNQYEARLPNGLVKGHAYSITAMRTVNGIVLLRIRNPWGNEQEWNGAWSDSSSEWHRVDARVKADLGLKLEHDGEFWMSFDDFMKNFEKMEICNLGPEVMNEIQQMTGIRTRQQQWSTCAEDGRWIRDRTAGGCRNYIETFAINPQYLMELTDSEPNDEDQLCTVIIAVMQKYRRELKSSNIDNLTIGFAVYEISGRFRLSPGRYIIVPSTFEPDMEGEFMLRAFANGGIQLNEI